MPVLSAAVVVGLVLLSWLLTFTLFTLNVNGNVFAPSSRLTVIWRSCYQVKLQSADTRVVWLVVVE